MENEIDRLWDLIAELEAQIDFDRYVHMKVVRERDEALKALGRLLAPFEGDECRKDHHGYCQIHFLEEDCCVASARRVYEGGKADGQ